MADGDCQGIKQPRAKRYLGACWAPKRYQCHRLQMGTVDQEKCCGRNWQIQGMTCSKRFHPSLWCRLLWDIRSCSKTIHFPTHTCNHSSQQLVHRLFWLQQHLSLLCTSGGDYLPRAATWSCHETDWQIGMPTHQNYLWLETGGEKLVQRLMWSTEDSRIQKVWGRPWSIFQGRRQLPGHSSHTCRQLSHYWQPHKSHQTSQGWSQPALQPYRSRVCQLAFGHQNHAKSHWASLVTFSTCLHRIDPNSVQFQWFETSIHANGPQSTPIDIPVPYEARRYNQDVQCALSKGHWIFDVCGHGNLTRYHVCCVHSLSAHSQPWMGALGGIFCYLLGMKELELVYGGDDRGLVGYTDADGLSQEHRWAISRYIFLVDGGAVSWSLKKQELITLSTTEAEYVAATHAAKEAI